MKRGCEAVQAVVLSKDESGLGIIKSLKKIGVRCAAIFDEADDLGLHSRLPHESVVIDGRKEYAAALLEVLEPYAGQGKVLIISTDYHVSIVADHLDYFTENFRFLAPSAETLRKLLDKQAESQLSMSLGISIPRSVVRLEPDAEWILKQLALPIIFKPKAHFDNVLGEKNIVVHSRGELGDFINRHGNVIGKVMAQEVIPGGEECIRVCMCVYGANNEPVSVFMLKRLSSCPKLFGVTGVAVSEYDEQLLPLIRALGKKMSLVGPADIEFKYDAREGEYKFIEVNPRIGGYIHFDTVCGVNNIANVYYLSRGEAGSVRSRRQKDGIYFVSAHQDLYWRYKLREPLVSTLKTYRPLFYRKTVHHLFAYTDMKPAMVCICRIFNSAVGKAWKKCSPKTGNP